MAIPGKESIPEGPIFDKTSFYIPNIIFFALSFFFVFLRLWSRRIQRLRLDGSDYCVLIALALSVLVTAAAYLGVANGAGEHADYLVYIDPTQGNITLLLKVLLFATVPYLLSLAFSRVSILLLYRALFPTQFMRISTVILGTVVTLVTVSAVLATIFSCKPVEGFWLIHVMDPPPQCISTFGLYLVVGLSTIVTDAACLLLPVWDILKLRLSKKDKITVMSMFFMGGLTIVVSIPRTVIISEGDGNDITYWIAGVALWSTIETAVAIICVCLPVLRPVVRRVKSWFGYEQTQTDTGTYPSARSKPTKSHSHKRSNSIVEMKRPKLGVDIEEWQSSVEVIELNEEDRFPNDSPHWGYDAAGSSHVHTDRVDQRCVGRQHQQASYSYEGDLRSTGRTDISWRDPFAGRPAPVRSSNPGAGSTPRDGGLTGSHRAMFVDRF